MAEKYQCPSCSMRESCGSLTHVRGSWRIGPLLASCLPCSLFLIQESSALTGEPAAYATARPVRLTAHKFPPATRWRSPHSCQDSLEPLRSQRGLPQRSPAPAGFRFGVSRCCKTDIASFPALCQNRRSGHVSRFPKNPLQRSDLHERQTAATPPLSTRVTLLPTRYLTLSPDL